MSVALVHAEGTYATGVARYARCLEGALRGLGEDVSSTPIARRELRIAGRAIGGYLSLWGARLAARRGHHDIVHALDPAVATSQADVVTVHDLLAETHPEWYQRDLASRVDWAFSRYHARRARCLIAVSEATRQDVIERWGVDSTRVQTIHSGIDHETFRPLEGPTPHLSSDVPNLVYVGDDNPRKNILLAVRAAAALKQNHGIRARLVRFGPSRFPRVHEEYVTCAAKNDVELIEPGFVADDELVASLSAADAFLWPTLAEGFGFPPLEAMACGTPVVAMDTPVNREVCDDLARYHADDAGEAAEAIESILKRPPERKRLVEHASRFTWERAARETAEVYHRLVGR